jgi:hypothetical protein
MTMVMLCRTQGMNINDFMFRQGSSIAMPILCYIAIEAAGLAFVEIRSAAVNLQRDTVWNLFLPPENTSKPLVSSVQVTELLELCSVTPLVSLLDNSTNSDRLREVLNDSSLLNPTGMCNCLAKDPSFSLAWESLDESGIENRYLFHLRTKELFLLIYTVRSGATCSVHLDLIEKRKNRAIETRNNGIVLMLANFVIHFLWNESTQCDQ